MATQPKSGSSGASKGSWWYLLLILPFAGLVFPGIYARQAPELDGIPFFYWYQFCWIVATALLTGFVYWRIRGPKD
jgi:hypothetical protein